MRLISSLGPLCDVVAAWKLLARLLRLRRTDNKLSVPPSGIRGPISGKMRFPGDHTAALLKEVKNVKSQGLTSQIKDYIAIAQNEGIPFELWVRASGTRLSKPLQAAIARKEVVLKLTPGI